MGGRQSNGAELLLCGKEKDLSEPRDKEEGSCLWLGRVRVKVK